MENESRTFQRVSKRSLFAHAHNVQTGVINVLVSPCWNVIYLEKILPGYNNWQYCNSCYCDQGDLCVLKHILLNCNSFFNSLRLPSSTKHLGVTMSQIVQNFVKKCKFSTFIGIKMFLNSFFPCLSEGS